MTGLPPLYFQHEGHSRTIIGIERRPAGGAGSSNAAGVVGAGGEAGAPVRGPIDAWLSGGRGREGAGKLGASSDPGSDGPSSSHPASRLPCKRPNEGGGDGEVADGGGSDGGAQAGTAGKQGKVAKFQAMLNAGAAPSAQQQACEDGYVYTLLVLDPGTPAATLEEALR